MNEVNEQEVLAKIRTLLALERNYLAEERTAMAEFRNGLALTVIGPTMSTIIAYILSVFTVEKSILLDLLNFAFFSILTIVGIWISFRSQSKLRIIKKKRQLLKKEQLKSVNPPKKSIIFYVIV